jgi:hypothetical protein
MHETKSSVVLSSRAVQLSGGTAFWTAQTETGLVAVVLVLPLHLHHCPGGPPPLNLSSRPEWRDLQFFSPRPLLEVFFDRAWRRDLLFHFRAQRKRHGRIASGFRFSINANCRSLRSGRDDKFKGGRPPWRWWTWMDRVNAPVGMTNSRAAACLGSGGGGGTEPNNEGPTPPQTALSVDYQPKS